MPYYRQGNYTIHRAEGQAPPPGFTYVSPQERPDLYGGGGGGGGTPPGGGQPPPAPYSPNPVGGGSYEQLRNQIRQGQIDPHDAVDQIQKSIAPPPNEAGGQAWQQYLKAKEDARVQLLSNLGTIRTVEGQFGTVDVSTGNVSRVSTRVIQSTTGAGGTQTRTYAQLSQAAPTIFRDLRPGSTGDDVRQLQNWLVLQGYMKQSDMNTGPGTYGPQTKAAVAKWQQAMGIDTKGNPGYFGPISRNFVSQQARAAAGGGVNINAPVVGADYQSGSSYTELPEEGRELVDMAYNTYAGNDPDAEARFSRAIELARSFADPYFRSLLTLTQGAFEGEIAKANFDYEAQAKAAQLTRDRLVEDVTADKEYLSFEQQADLAKLARGFEEDLMTIADTAEAKGLTFATGIRSRMGAEARQQKEYGDVVQSSRRTFNYRIRDLEMRKARGDENAAITLENLQRGRGFTLGEIGRRAEEALGSSNLPYIPGYTPAGGFAGQIEARREAQVREGAGFFDVGLARGFDYKNY